MPLAELLRLSRACPLLLSAAALFAGELKVDINRDGKNTAAQTAAGYVQWAAAADAGTLSEGTAAITRSFPVSGTDETVTVALSMTAAAQAAGGTGLTYTYHHASTLAEGSKLVGDGITVAPSVLNTGGQIQMTLTGLAAGKHTLLTYHNAGDSAVQLLSLAPIKAYLNGALAATIHPSIRASDQATPAAYFTFQTASPSDVTTILFEADPAASAGTKNVVLNGFEIDTSNEARRASNPSPSDGDIRAKAGSGGATLSWSSATQGAADSHDIYFGADEAAVRAADRSSPAYLGNQSETTRTVQIADRSATHYWRVDERDELGNVSAGAVWSFRLPAPANTTANTAPANAATTPVPVFVCLGGKGRMSSVISIPPPGYGWDHSAVAPVPGDMWNRVSPTSGIDATDPAIAPGTAPKKGIHILDTANRVPLVDPSGKPSGVTLVIQLEIAALATDKARVEPSIHSKSKGALPPGLMDAAWRVFLPQNSLRFALEGLAPGRTYDLYAYAAALDPVNNKEGANDGALFTVAAANRPPGSKPSFETTGGYSASVITYNPDTNKIAPSPAGTTWVQFPVIADPAGGVEFSTGRNSFGRHFVNGFQLVPRAGP